MFFSKKRRGFTLIELLTVIAIIGILAGIVVVAVQEPRKRGRDAKRISDMHSLKSALEIYYEQNQKFPTTGVSGADITTDSTGWASSNIPSEWTTDGTTTKALAGFLTNYLNPLPKDQLNGQSVIYKVLSGTPTATCQNGTAGPMMYEYKSTGQAYKVRTHLEALCDGTTDGSTNDSTGAWYELWGGDGGESL